MRPLVKTTIDPGDMSPYSAVVISGDHFDVKRVGDTFSLNRLNIGPTVAYRGNRDVFEYIFDFGGEKKIFSEKPFPAEWIGSRISFPWTV